MAGSHRRKGVNQASPKHDQSEAQTDAVRPALAGESSVSHASPARALQTRLQRQFSVNHHEMLLRYISLLVAVTFTGMWLAQNGQILTV